MDIELLHTFLEVDSARHFGRAAERLCVTQAAVSARIKLLESTLGTTLFVRKRNDIRLTPAGEQLKLHAAIIVNAWRDIRRAGGPGQEPGGTLAVGVTHDVGALVLPSWFAALGALGDGRSGLRYVTADPAALARMLDRQQLDLVLTPAPEHRQGLEQRRAGNLDLRLVSTVKAQACDDALGKDYVFVDWGAWFRDWHERRHRLHNPANRTTDSAMLAANMLLHTPGSAYLPRQLIAMQPFKRRLHPVIDAPVAVQPLFAQFHAADARRPRLREALALIRRVRTNT